MDEADGEGRVEGGKGVTLVNVVWVEGTIPLEVVWVEGTMPLEVVWVEGMMLLDVVWSSRDGNCTRIILPSGFDFGSKESIISCTRKHSLK